MESRPRNRFGFFLRKYNFFLLLIFFWGFVYLILLGNNSLLSRFNLQTRMTRTTSDIDRLRGENQALKNQIDKIKNDRDHMEFLARRLGFIRPGEVVYKFESAESMPKNPAGHRLSGLESFIRRNLKFIIMGLAVLSLAGAWLGISLKERGKRRGLDSLPR